MNRNYEPTDSEEAVLDVFKNEGERVNPLLLRQRTGLGKGDVNTALSNLRAAGWVRRVVRGLYEFVGDPRVAEDDDSMADVLGSVETTLDDSEPVERVQMDEDDTPPGLEGVEFPTTVDDAAARAAVQAAREFLAEEGAATKGQMVREVMPEHPLGYDVEDAIATVDSDDRYRGSWWRRCLKPGLEAVEGVEKPTGGRSRWRYTGDGEGE